MTATRRIVLALSPDLYGRLEARAAEANLLAAVSRPESKAVLERRSREAGFALLSLLAGRPAGETGVGQERGNHA